MKLSMRLGASPTQTLSLITRRVMEVSPDEVPLMIVGPWVCFRCTLLSLAKTHRFSRDSIEHSQHLDTSLDRSESTDLDPYICIPRDHRRRRSERCRDIELFWSLQSYIRKAAGHTMLWDDRDAGDIGEKRCRRSSGSRRRRSRSQGGFTRSRSGTG